MPLSRTTKRRILALGLPLLVLGGLKGWMLWGPAMPGTWARVQDSFGKTTPVPGAPPALFPWHAELLLKSELGFPRKLEGFLPVPEPRSTAYFQLEGMGLWDGAHWTPKATDLGTPEGRGLRLRMGELVVVEVETPTPSRDYNGPQLCQVDYRVRWVVPDELKSLMLVDRMVGLRPPPRLEIPQPGGEASQQITLQRVGLGFRLWKGEDVRAELPGRPAKGRAWWRWFL
jgi:hypothetical protein